MADYPAKFEQFWKAYPRKVSKINALKAWAKQGCEADMYMAQAAIDDVEKRTRLKWWSTDSSKIPHPATWINSKRWEDEGWEGETESGKKAVRPPPRGAEWQPDEQPPMDWEERVLGRLWLSYVVEAKGVPDAAAAIAIKRDLLEKFVPDYREEIEAGEITKADMAETMARLFVGRLDKHYGLALGNRVIEAARRKATRAA